MSEKRNILFIHCDSMDGRVMGCLDHPAMRSGTPNLDTLARRGVLFRDTYCNNPICCPSRASMWSGRWTHHCEGWNNYKGLSAEDRTFRDSLDGGGYLTQTFGKEDYLSGGHSVRARVSPWTRSANIERPAYRMNPPKVVEDDTERVHTQDWEDVDTALDWIRDVGLRDERPFWLNVGIRAPHPPFRVSRRYMDMIDPAGVEPPPPDECDHPVLRYQRTHKNWQHGLDEDQARLVRHIYFAMVAEVDAMVGRLLSGVEDLGLSDSTYVVFSSDHGEMAMEHGQFYKMSPYEPSSRVPLIIAGPGVTAGAATDKPTSLVDLYPTFMDMAGLPTPDGLDGHSLLPEAAGGPSDRPDWALTEFHGTSINTGCFMLRKGDWKYIVYVGYAPQLFRLKDDPWEINDLSGSRPDVVKEMDDLLRTIVDYESVDAKVKAYDRRSFRQWREKRKAEGTYEDTMAQIFTGFDRLEGANIQPWTEEDERKIEEWLAAE